jgi:hypothetical protein
MGFLKPKAPPPPPPPPPAPPVKPVKGPGSVAPGTDPYKPVTDKDTETTTITPKDVVRASTEEELLKKGMGKKKGRSSTILSGSMGDTSQATLKYSSLLKN